MAKRRAAVASDPRHCAQPLRLWLGAIFLDLGLDAVRGFVLPIVQADAERETMAALHKDPKSRLQEWSQSSYGILPRYKQVDHCWSGPCQDFYVSGQRP